MVRGLCPDVYRRWPSGQGFRTMVSGALNVGGYSWWLRLGGDKGFCQVDGSGATRVAEKGGQRVSAFNALGYERGGEKSGKGLAFRVSGMSTARILILRFC